MTIANTTNVFRGGTDSWTTNLPYRPTKRKYKKPYDSGRRIYEAICSCGKRCTEFEQYQQHTKAKHPKRHRLMKKYGDWE